MRRIICLIVLGALAPTCAHARDCRAAIFENQRHARIIEHTLRQLDTLNADVADLEAHADAVYIDPKKALRSTVLFTGGTRFASLGQRCHDPAVFDQTAMSTPLSFMGGVRFAPLGLGLHLFALGRGDLLRLQTAAGADQQVEVLGQYRGVIGARLQVTEWVAVGLARVGTERGDADDPALRGIFADEAAGPDWLYELAIPVAGLSARLTTDGAALFLREAALRDVEVVDRWRVSADWADLATEARQVITGRVAWSAVPIEGRVLTPGLDTWGEVALETDAVRVRHLRAGLTAPMIGSSVTRTSWTRIGVDISQRAALSVHRGAQMQAASRKTAAVGAEWDVQMKMRTPYITFGFDFGLGFNVPEMLDLYPGMANSLTLGVGMRLGSHW